MQKRGSKPRGRIRLRILIILLILSVPPLVVGHLLLVSAARENYWELIGTHLSQRADDVQRDMINSLDRVSLQVANLTAQPDILTIVRQSNEQRFTQQELQKNIQEIEDQWQAMDPEKSRFLQSILENAASQFLRDYNSVVAAFREIIVTDVHGRVVAATNKSSDYFQADERWWSYTYLEGSGNRFISDIQFDESANVYGIEVAQPIKDSSTQAVIGIMKVIVDRYEIFGLMETFKVGQDGYAVLMRSDGTVIFSPQNTLRYEFAEDVQMARANRLFVEALEIQTLPEAEHRVLLGLPQFQFRDRLPETDWSVVVQVPYDEVSAPFRNINTWFFYIVFFMGAVVVILAFIFSWLLSKPVIETDPHLERL
jgi:hypothetical protein